MMIWRKAGSATEAADTNPVPSTIYAKTTTPGDTPLMMDGNGALKVSLYQNTFRMDTIEPSVDGITGTSFNPLSTINFAYVFNGNTWDRARTPNVFKPISAVSINAETTIWTPAAGKKFRLMGFLLVGSAAGNVTLKDNTAGTTILIVPTGAGGPGIPSPPMGNGILSSAANNVLTATGSVNMNLSGVVFGTEE